LSFRKRLLLWGILAAGTLVATVLSCEVLVRFISPQEPLPR
jgi:hypothetical protein